MLLPLNRTVTICYYDEVKMLSFANVYYMWSTDTHEFNVSSAHCWNVGSDWLRSSSVLHDCSRATELYQLSWASCLEGQDVSGLVQQAVCGTGACHQPYQYVLCSFVKFCIKYIYFSLHIFQNGIWNCEVMLYSKTIVVHCGMCQMITVVIILMKWFWWW